MQPLLFCYSCPYCISGRNLQDWRWGEKQRLSDGWRKVVSASNRLVVRWSLGKGGEKRGGRLSLSLGFG
ncbi:hypothetical protein HMPREF1555_01651 [Porphyromonas gingivalis F0570]|uniref:Uncharacterized protein n=1 Tax=Porphyromonas gingivalis F0570 TaxID=1227271 RepID=A0A0E2LPR6_PORGN|nr:hypothetical protein HMPREF1555_01651 [Porphyromonas gingivalis F0570]